MRNLLNKFATDDVDELKRRLEGMFSTAATNAWMKAVKGHETGSGSIIREKRSDKGGESSESEGTEVETVDMSGDKARFVIVVNPHYEGQLRDNASWSFYVDGKKSEITNETEFAGQSYKAHVLAETSSASNCRNERLGSTKVRYVSPNRSNSSGQILKITFVTGYKKGATSRLLIISGLIGSPDQHIVHSEKIQSKESGYNVGKFPGTYFKIKLNLSEKHSIRSCPA